MEKEHREQEATREKGMSHQQWETFGWFQPDLSSLVPQLAEVAQKSVPFPSVACPSSASAGILEIGHWLFAKCVSVDCAAGALAPGDDRLGRKQTSLINCMFEQ